MAYSGAWNLSWSHALPQAPIPGGLSLTGKVARDQAEDLWKIAAKLAYVNLGRGEAAECPELKDASACHELWPKSCEHSRRCNWEAASLFPIILIIFALAPLLT